MNIKFLSKSAQETLKLGTRLSRKLCAGDIVCLFGNLGAGKTTLAKGIAKGLNINAKTVVSPTFTFLNLYQGKRPFYHFDFYRLEHPKEISGIGLEEFLYGQGVSVIEWPERLGILLPRDHIAVRASHKGKDQRCFVISGHGARAKQVLKELSA